MICLHLPGKNRIAGFVNEGHSLMEEGPMCTHYTRRRYGRNR
jgi:hypothetical protein